MNLDVLYALPYYTYYIIIYYTILCYIILHCTISYHTTLSCTTQHYTSQHYDALVCMLLRIKNLRYYVLHKLHLLSVSLITSISPNLTNDATFNKQILSQHQINGSIVLFNTLFLSNSTLLLIVCRRRRCLGLLYNK